MKPHTAANEGNGDYNRHPTFTLRYRVIVSRPVRFSALCLANFSSRWHIMPSTGRQHLAIGVGRGVVRKASGFVQPPNPTNEVNCENCTFCA